MKLNLITLFRFVINFLTISSISLINNYEVVENLSSNQNEFLPEYFSQLIDHTSNETFLQRYYRNDLSYQSGGPAFLLLGGESALNVNSVEISLASGLVRRYHGVLFSLEHRYYGKSHPFNDTSLDNLRYLSSEYAIKDIIRFADSMKDPQTNEDYSQWFVLGYSYSGNLAAWSRQMAPDLFDGALASSAPIQVTEDFYEYDEFIRYALDSKCSNNMELIVETIDEMYESNYPQFQTLKSKLQCSSLNDKLFLYTIYDSFSYAVQYNQPHGKVNLICHQLTGTTPDLLVNQFIDAINNLLLTINETCTSFSRYDKLIDTAINSKSSSRQWNYQCCKEFGYWQTTPLKHSLRSKYLTVDWFNNHFCSPPFYNHYIGPPQTHPLNQRHRGRDIDIDQIIFTNGNKDPWSALSITHNQTKSNNTIIIIDDGSHTPDYLIPLKSNSPSLTAAYQSIISTFDEWVLS